MKKQELAKREILQEALKNVPFDGWTDAVLRQASRHKGYAAGYEDILFPGGVADLVAFFTEEADREMTLRAEQLPLQDMRIRDRIAAIIWARLEYHTQHKEAIQPTLRFSALHGLQASKQLAHTVSTMWYLAGDKATDFNYYSKRFLLSGVYSSTLLFWISDDSENYAETKAFLARRIENVMSIGSIKQRLYTRGSSIFQKLRRHSIT